MTIQKIPIGDVILDPRLQMRATMDFEVIDEYAEHLDVLPPCKVVTLKSPHVGGDDANYLTSGWHRYHAHKKAGAATLPCEVTEGDFSCAILEAAGENHGHGIRRTPEDKERAVKAILETAEFADKSDRMIAEICHVSHSFVGKIRAESSTGRESSSKPRVGKDKKTRPASQPHRQKAAAGLPGPTMPSRFSGRAGVQPSTNGGPQAAPAPPKAALQQQSSLHVKAQTIIHAIESALEQYQQDCEGSDGVLRKGSEKFAKTLTHAIADLESIANPSAQQNGKLELPPELDSDKFREAWSEWNTFRKQKKQALTPLSIKKQLAQLSAMGEATAIESINISITNGWTGLFAPKKGGTNGRVSRVEAPAGKYDNIGITIKG